MKVLSKKQINKILKEELAFDKDNNIIIKEGIAQRDIKKGEVFYYYPSVSLRELLIKGDLQEKEE